MDHCMVVELRWLSSIAASVAVRVSALRAL